LEEVVKRGFALDRGEESETYACAAAPVFDHRGEAVAALWVSGPSDRVREERIVALGLQVKKMAAVLSQRLGHATGQGAEAF
jgi:IclR family acetate operon transcriptional repressor